MKVCIGFSGLLTPSVQTNYKLDPKGVVDLMGTHGMRLIAPMEIDAPKYAGLEWDLDKFKPNKQTIIAPLDTIYYQNEQGRNSIRFTDFEIIEESDHETENNKEKGPILKKKAIFFSQLWESSSRQRQDSNLLPQ